MHGQNHIKFENKITYILWILKDMEYAFLVVYFKTFFLNSSEIIEVH